MLSTLNKGVFIIGRGKVGNALARECKKARIPVRHKSSRTNLPKNIAERLVILAVRDPAIEAAAKNLVGRLHNDSVVVHVSGAKGPDALSALRGHCAGVAQMHPLLAFASSRTHSPVAGGFLLISGDKVAIRLARAFGSSVLRMRSRSVERVDLVGYHAAAGLLANGAAALAGKSFELLTKSGIPRNLVPTLLGPLLRSVAFNVEQFGLPDALTGPVRRGDYVAVANHAAVIRERIPDSYGLYLAILEAQWFLAKELGEASARDLKAIQRIFHAKSSKDRIAVPSPRRSARTKNRTP